MKKAKRGRKPEQERLKEVFEAWRKKALAGDGPVEVFSDNSKSIRSVTISASEFRTFKQCYTNGRPRRDFPKSWFVSRRGNILIAHGSGRVSWGKPSASHKKGGVYREYHEIVIGGKFVKLEPGEIVNLVHSGYITPKARGILESEGLLGETVLHHALGYRYAHTEEELGELRAVNCKETVICTAKEHGLLNEIRGEVTAKKALALMERMAGVIRDEGIAGPVGIVKSPKGNFINFSPKIRKTAGGGLSWSMGRESFERNPDDRAAVYCEFDFFDGETGELLEKGEEVKRQEKQLQESLLEDQALQQKFRVGLMWGDGFELERADGKKYIIKPVWYPERRLFVVV